MNASWESIAAGVALLAAIAAYAIFSGADFGGGIWDLLAGGTKRGAAPRAAIDASLTPVWEGNHVWIIFGLVILWTAFPPAFAAIMTALFVPLCLSLLGIFFRGVGFAFRHEAERLPTKRLTGGLFAASSLLAPFFLGTAVGAVVTGRVRANATGSPISAWFTPTAFMTGALFVAACAYVSAVYLVGDSRRREEPTMVAYFSRRAVVSGILTGALAAGNLILLHTSSPVVFHRLMGPALPLVAVSIGAGLAALVLIYFKRLVLVRVMAALAVVSVVGGWGWAQYPWLLPRTLSLQAGSAPTSGLQAELAVVLLAGLLVGPSFVYLYWLQQHGRLEETQASENLVGAAVAQNSDVTPRPYAEERTHRVLAVALIMAAVTDLIRDFGQGRRKQG